MSTLDALDEFTDDRGFISQDFAIVKLLGKLGVQVNHNNWHLAGSTVLITRDILQQTCNLLLIIFGQSSAQAVTGVGVAAQKRVWCRGASAAGESRIEVGLHCSTAGFSCLLRYSTINLQPLLQPLRHSKLASILSNTTPQLLTLPPPPGCCLHLPQCQRHRHPHN